ncbi:MAG: CPBP family intramembrane metalloprotease [Candidatus Solibacter usitatus]|nr:CPBP family intramembrane metalloprotease [Candidatus Solibacter usitatus]
MIPGEQQEPQPRNPFWTYEDLALFVGLSIPCFLVGGLAAGLVKAFTKIGQTGQVLVAEFIAYPLLFGALALLLRTKYGAPFWASMKWTAPAATLWKCAALGPALAVFVGMLAYFLRAPEIDPPFKDSFVATAIFGVTIAPACEELAFRGFLMPLLVRSAGASAGILLTTVPFTLLHGQQYSWSWQILVGLTVAGSAFGIVRHATGSTLAAAMMHAAYNLTLFCAFFAQRQFNPNGIPW